MGIRNRFIKSALWCKKIRPFLIQYRVLTLVGFGVLSMTSLFRDFTHSEEMTRKDVTVAYLRNEKDEVQKRLDTCQTNAARLERTFNLFVKSLNKKK